VQGSLCRCWMRRLVNVCVGVFWGGGGRGDRLHFRAAFLSKRSEPALTSRVQDLVRALVHVKPLECLTCRAEVLARVVVARVLGKVLADCSSHCQPPIAVDIDCTATSVRTTITYLKRDGESKSAHPCRRRCGLPRGFDPQECRWHLRACRHSG